MCNSTFTYNRKTGDKLVCAEHVTRDADGRPVMFHTADYKGGWWYWTTAEDDQHANPNHA